MIGSSDARPTNEADTVNEVSDRRERDGMAVVVAVCALAGTLVVGATLRMGDHQPSSRAGTVPPIATEEYGRRLVAQTSELIGPDHADPSMRYSGTRMACGSCHLGGGAEPGTLSLLEGAARYPRFSGRDGGERDLQDRINGCMTRSMNGRELPRDGAEMLAIAAYIETLGDQWAAMGAGQRTANESASLSIPDRAADISAGERVFGERCAICHGIDGSGLLATPNRLHGYVFPPLWGPDSFNNGAGMHRVLTAARFIKARMPLGQPDLTDDQAFDVAAYINAQPRPAMSGLDRDYPDRASKPIDGPYGPFDDDFPIEQHRFGPFGPIEEYYKTRTARD